MIRPRNDVIMFFCPMNKRNITIISLALLAYIAATIGAFFLFSETQVGRKLVVSQSPLTQTSSTAPGTHQDANGTMIFDQSAPKTESCPINGALYSSDQKTWWQQHEPMGVMIENHTEARPQSGLSYADVVYEAVAEGGITRFLGIFYCQDAPQIGPVRSARVYFINFLSEYGPFPLYTHVGGANEGGPADALGEIAGLGWDGYNDLNQFSIGFPTFWRDYNRLGHTVATEHTMYSTTGKLWAYAKQNRNITSNTKDGAWDKTFTPYGFKDDTDLSARPISQTVHLEFWSSDSDYFVDWIYDPKANVYKRNNGGVPHLDKDTNKQLSTKNLVVFHMEESHANDGYENNVHLLYKNIGSGDADVFIDGKQIKATWRKDSRTARTLLYDSSKNPIKFDRGTIWFSVLPLNGVMTVK